MDCLKKRGRQSSAPKVKSPCGVCTPSPPRFVPGPLQQASLPQGQASAGQRAREAGQLRRCHSSHPLGAGGPSHGWDHLQAQGAWWGPRGVQRRHRKSQDKKQDT